MLLAGAFDRPWSPPPLRRRPPAPRRCPQLGPAGARRRPAPARAAGLRDPVRAAARGRWPPPPTTRARSTARCAPRSSPTSPRGRANLVVFDEDIGLETIAIGPRGAAAGPCCERRPRLRREASAVRNAGDADGARQRLRPGADLPAVALPAARRPARPGLRRRHRRVRARVHDDDGRPRRAATTSTSSPPTRRRRSRSRATPPRSRRCAIPATPRSAACTRRPPAPPTTRRSCGDRGSCTAARRRRWRTCSPTTARCR